MVRLGINIDHIATLRNARGENFPSVVEAALVAETNGADLITVHLREDRRHIKDIDVINLKNTIKTELNLEMALTQEMINFALEIKPDFVCIVPENRQELTTEGGLDVLANFDALGNAIEILKSQNILTSLFVDANSDQITAASDLGAYSIEIHTGHYGASKKPYLQNECYYRIKDMCELAHSLELAVNAGHGLNYHNVKPIANLPQMNELNIGFAIIANSLFWGMPTAVAKMKQLICEKQF
jgi:pyridoxine 5-phosphate synthase